MNMATQTSETCDRTHQALHRFGERPMLDPLTQQRSQNHAPCCRVAVLGRQLHVVRTQKSACGNRWERQPLCAWAVAV